MLRFFNILLLTIVLTAGFVITASGQGGAIDRLKGMAGGFSGGGGTGDSVAHRTGLEDSITINFRFLDSSRMRGFDSGIIDFDKRVPLPWTQIHLGNFGTASRKLLFEPIMRPGWDHGFHAYDNYLFTVDETHFYNTTRPYTELNYLLGGRGEQMINVIHTQNVRPNWNVGLQYRLINSPGLFQNQNVNHNSYRFHSWYQSPNKRYQNFIIAVANKLQAGENGGVRDIRQLDSVGFEERSGVAVRLGLPTPNNRNFFQTNIGTGTFFTNATYLMRQQYDLGQKDSIVTDSTVIPLFYPRLRLEHTISYSTYKYRFRDNAADSAGYYKEFYDLTLPRATDTFFIKDHWRELFNDFSIYQFPDAKNSQQFIKVGASLQLLNGTFDSGYASPKITTTKDHNFFVHGEYRNRTRNKKWDIEANGAFYVNGVNAGDYQAYISLQRYLGAKLGYLKAGFHNVNRTPSFVFNPNSSFYLDTAISFNKENISNIFASLDLPRLKLRLTGNYYLVSNLTYLRNYYEPGQASTLFNLLQVTAEKRFNLGKKGWNWKAAVILQQRAGDAPINVPLITTRQTIGYDGRLGFKNLLISFGLEGRYFTPYKAPAYSPLLGQYYVEQDTTIKQMMPDITAYMHFKIKTFNAYVRAENLNALDPSKGGFTNNNIPTLNYPYQGLQIRVGIFWVFVN